MHFHDEANQMHTKMHPIFSAGRSEIYILGGPRMLLKPWKENFSEIRISQVSPDETVGRSFHPLCNDNYRPNGPFDQDTVKPVQ